MSVLPQVDKAQAALKAAESGTAEAAAAGSQVAKLRHETSQLQTQLQEAAAANLQLQQQLAAALEGGGNGSSPQSEEARNRRLYGRSSAGKQQAEATIDAGGGTSSLQAADAETRQQELQLASLRSELRATQSQVRSVATLAPSSGMSALR